MSWEYIKFNKKEIKLGEQIYLAQKVDNNRYERIIEIVFATDNNYVQHCCAAIASVLLNCDNTSKLIFYILDGGIDDENRKCIKNLKKIRDFELIFYDMTKYDFSRFPMNRDYISISTYYRLMLPEILPQTTNKVIYLDCDVIVEKDLKEIWEEDISAYLAGVVEDEGSITQQMRLGMSLDSNYFNAGILVLNIQNLRTFDFINECIQYYEKNKSLITLQDQDILNGIFEYKVKYLPLCWNTNGRLYCGNELLKHYSYEDAINAGYNPGIIHYTDCRKPWQTECRHPLIWEYWKYLGYTDYKNKIKSFKFLYILNQIRKNLYSNEKVYMHYVVRFLFIKFRIKSHKLEFSECFNNYNERLNLLEYRNKEIVNKVRRIYAESKYNHTGIQCREVFEKMS